MAEPVMYVEMICDEQPYDTVLTAVGEMVAAGAVASVRSRQWRGVAS
ncbi:hypothetical protein [Streptomyces sp. S.PB5]|nr:hypothetical protein [Streptomyces sp. S.PB5]MDN3029126.1 hypothetical protein [Streptomyces sp. S.PB5]